MLRAGQTLQLLVVALLGLAVLLVYSAGMRLEGHPMQWYDVMFSRHGAYAGLAIAAMLIASRIDIRQVQFVEGWGNPLPWLLGSSIALVVLALVPGLGRSVNGASRWLYLGPASLGLSFQPSELVKWVMLAALSYWCVKRRGVMHLFREGLGPPLVLVGVSCGLIMIEDLGTAVLIGMASVGLLIAGGARLWQLALMLPVAAGGVVIAVIQSPYRVSRLLSFLDPWSDAQGIGYHPIQSMLAIAEGGLTGRGLGNSIQKFGYLPADTTDFIFAIICEEMGVFGAAMVVFLYLMLMLIGLNIVRGCKDTFGRLFALGVTLTIGLQAMMNIAVVTVVVPTKGIALPLLSAGGTGWIVTGFALGLVAALDEGNMMLAGKEVGADRQEEAGAACVCDSPIAGSGVAV
jgi:cell division protein FtsW